MKSPTFIHLFGPGFGITLTLVAALAAAQEDASAPDKHAAQGIQWNAITLRGVDSPYKIVDVSGSLLADNGLGVDVAALDPALRSQLGIANDQGLIVTAVPEESQGHKDGLKVHDVIVEVKGIAVGKPEQFKELLQPAGKEPIVLRAIRSGQPLELKVRPSSPEFAQFRFDEMAFDLAVAAAHQQPYRLGLQLAEVDDALRTQLRLASGEGLLVTEVMEKTPAEKAGVVANDVLTVLDGKRLTTVEAINAQIQEIKEREVELRLLRQGKEVSLQVTPRKAEEAAAQSEMAITLWDVQNCRGCHASAHGADNLNLAWATLADSQRRHPSNLAYANLYHLHQGNNQPTDQHTVARRLFLDLLGRLPSPDELKSLEGDKSPEAFSNVVKQLLGSDEFIERWALLNRDATTEGQPEGQTLETQRQVETLELELSQAQEAIRALKASLQREHEQRK